MAARRRCSNCGAENPLDNRFCEDCGYDMDMAESLSRMDEELYCPNGHEVMDIGLGFCEVCGERLVSEKPVILRPDYGDETVTEWAPPAQREAPVLKKTPVVNPAGTRCPHCGAVNPRENIYCEVCGESMSGKPAVGDEPSGSGPREVIDEVIEIPDPADTLAEAPADVPVFRPYRDGSKGLPPIPDIMKPLTNNDMKRNP